VSEKPEKKPVKLYVYQKEGSKTYIDAFEAESFDDFLLVRTDFKNMTQEDIAHVHDQVKGDGDKPVLLIDTEADISFYGLKEELENEN